MLLQRLLILLRELLILLLQRLLHREIDEGRQFTSELNHCFHWAAALAVCNRGGGGASNSRHQRCLQLYLAQAAVAASTTTGIGAGCDRPA